MLCGTELEKVRGKSRCIKPFTDSSPRIDVLSNHFTSIQESFCHAKWKFLKEYIYNRIVTNPQHTGRKSHKVLKYKGFRARSRGKRQEWIRKELKKVQKGRRENSL